MSKTGRPTVLDDAKKEMILTLTRVGLTRRQIARHVGCDEGTIRYAINHDEAFAQQVAEAEVSVEAELMTNLLANSRRSWRASAWALERLNPRRFGPYGERKVRDEGDDEIDALLASLGGPIAR